MSVFRRYVYERHDGAIGEAHLVRNLNIERTPDAREKILDGSFQVDMVNGTRAMRPFLYVDRIRKTLIYALPQNQRYLWSEASAALEVALTMFPTSVFKGKNLLRVVFGLAELREKLVIQDAGLDDRLVELLKVLVLDDHPFLLQQPRLNLVVDHVNDDEIVFIALFDHDNRRFEVKLRWESITDIDIETLKQWINKNHQHDFFRLEKKGDFWINLWRWAPKTTALQRLHATEKALDNTNDIDMDSHEFNQMLRYLPRGNQLPSWAKQALRKISRYAKSNKRPDIEERLFELRFDIALEDDWAYNDDPEDIDTLWDLLKNLPDSNVEGNTAIREILLEEKEGGGWYDPVNYDIGIGENELGDEERFANVVRHEIGHAVHQQHSKLVDDFLESQYGWQTFLANNDGIDYWVGLMGGWGNLSAQHRQQARSLIRMALGRESWKPGIIQIPSNHFWLGEGFGPRLAFEHSTNPNRYWWDNNQTWYTANGKAFAYNFYYKELMVVNQSAIEALSNMPDAYAAMSPAEYFAELYAVYYDLEANTSFLPDTIQSWFNENIGEPGTELD